MYRPFVQCAELYERGAYPGVTRDLCTIVRTVQEFYGTSEKVLVEWLKGLRAMEHPRPR